MQNASASYEDASGAAGGAWAPPKLMIDWMRDGYDVTPNMVDFFNRNLADRFGTTDTGQDWINITGPATAFDVIWDGTDTLVGGYGQHTITEPNDGVSYLTRNSVLNGPKVFVTDQLIKVGIPTPVGGNIEVGMFLRFVDAGNFYRSVAVVDTGGGVNLAITRSVGFAEDAPVSTSAAVASYTAGQVLAVRTRMLADGTIQSKAWIDGTTQPDWQLTYTDPAQILTPGVAGLRTVVYPGNTTPRPVLIKYYEYRVTNGLPDDVSNQLGGWSVTHHLDDGYPDNVTFIAGVGVPELSADIGAPPAHQTGGVPQQVAEYYSPYNTASPLYGRDRDVAPVTLDHGVITANGPERIRVFTGQMLDLPVRRGKAALSATSRTRLALSSLVQPPPAYGLYQGANATWEISYALAACGVYASPPPQPGCRWWSPQHGSARPFIPSATHRAVDMLVTVNGLSGLRRTLPIEWVTGPFVLGGRYSYNSNWIQGTGSNGATGDGVYLEAGDNLVSSAGLGKVECWVRGDPTELNASPGASGGISTWWRWLMTNTNGSLVDVGITASPGSSDRKPYLNVNDGSLKTFTHSTAVPADGEWHFVGWAWSIAGSKRWINLDGVVETNSTAITAGGYPAQDTFATNRPFVQMLLPTAEVQVTAGAYGNPDNHPWLRDIPFTPGAVLNPSRLELASIVEPRPREAWELIASFAQAELAALRTDEHDIVTYLTSGWWVKTAQQVVAELVSTETSAGQVDLNIDPTKIRNSIRITFNEAFNVDTWSLVASLRDVITLAPGATTIVVPLNPSAVELRGLTFTNVAAADTTQPLDTNNISINSETNGTGTYATSGEVSALVTEWNSGQAVVVITNTTGATWYTANNKNWQVLGIAAKSVPTSSAFVTDADAATIATRGERVLAIDSQVLQTRVNARRLARVLKLALRTPTPIMEGLTEFGEARRQPGDLVQFEDPSVTRASGLWRRQSVTHKYSPDGSYTQDTILRPTLPICVVGEGIIGQSLVGPEE
ncbi:MAG TPA: hypothetical protein VF516_00225 [Kofleriaceae bacterium]